MPLRRVLLISALAGFALAALFGSFAIFFDTLPLAEEVAGLSLALSGCGFGAMLCLLPFGRRSASVVARLGGSVGECGKPDAAERFAERFAVPDDE